MVTHALIDCILYVCHGSYGDPDFADTLLEMIDKWVFDAGRLAKGRCHEA